MRTKAKWVLPTILSVVASAGVVATAVAATKGAKKANDILEKHPDNLSKKDKLKLVLPAYAPTIFIGASTVACVLGSNLLNTRNQINLSGACVLAEQSFKEYRDKLIELHGPEIDEEVRTDIARVHSDYHIIDLDTPDRKMKFYEPVSGECVEMYERELMDAEYHFNRNFVLRGEATLYEFLNMLGVPGYEDKFHHDYTQHLGWCTEWGYYWVDFTHEPYKDGYLVSAVFGPDDLRELH